MIKIQNLYKSFGDNEILKDISADVDQGKVIAIIGPSGSGKSTLLRCLNLLETPTKGHICISEQEITSPKCDVRQFREKVGMVFQHFHLFPNMTVLQNITYAPRQVLKLSKDDAEQRAMVLLEKVGLADKANVYPSKLSGGQKQRVAIARTLAMDPEVILFDEPTSALDPEMVKEVLQVIRDLVKTTKITTLIVTHEMAFAREVAHEIWFLVDGRLIEQTPPDQFFTTPQSERAKEFLEKIL